MFLQTWRAIQPWQACIQIFDNMTLFSRCSALRVLIAIGHLHSTEGMLESGCFCLPAICEVVIRNTVPFQTALCERVALKKPLDVMLVLALLITFLGTVLYSEAWPQYSVHSCEILCLLPLWITDICANLQVTDLTIRYNGAIYAICNATLVAGMCTYERYLMTSANLGMSAIDINFHRVVTRPNHPL